ARQLLLPGMGEAGQERLAAARVRVVGAGPVAGPAMLYLAQAGVGALLIDDAMAIAPCDASAWIYRRGREGSPRAPNACAALKEASRFVRAEPFRAGAAWGAALVAADEPDLAGLSAEEARRAGAACVVAAGQGERGVVLALPAGAPCLT